MLPLIVAAVLGAAPLDRAHAAVATAMASGDGGGCDPAELRAAAAAAEITQLGHLGASDVVLAAVHAPCVCGNVNCPYYVLRLDAGATKTLYATYGYALTTVGAAPLPRLVVLAHDSALVSDETTAAYQSGRYVEVTSVRVRGDTGARKPNDVPVRFAAGASSATLRGTASSGWYDSYAFDAQKGQTLTIGAVHARAPVSVTVFAVGTGAPLPIVLDKPTVLPRTGTYHLDVEVAADRDVPYTLTLAIR